MQNEVENKNKIGVVFDENHFPDIFTPFEIASYMSRHLYELEHRRLSRVFEKI